MGRRRDATGDAITFRIADVGGAPLEVPIPAPADLVTIAPDSTTPGSLITVTGAAFPVTWTPGGGERIRILLYENEYDAGGAENQGDEYIACEVEDTGSYTIPAELVVELDFPVIDLEVSRANFEEVSAGNEILRLEVRSAIYTREALWRPRQC